MDSFHSYLKKQLLEYVEVERKKGVSLEEIEKILIGAGHEKNIIDEVFEELEKEQLGKETTSGNKVEKDIISMIKNAFSQFMAQATKKEINEAKKDFKKTDTEELLKEVIDDAKVIEEKTMLEGVVFFIYIIAFAFIVLLTAGATDSSITNVVIGFLPVIINAFLSFLALRFADMVPVYVFIPLSIVSVFYALGRFTGVPIFQNLDMEPLAVVNFLFGFLFNVLIVYVRFLKPKHMKKKIILAEQKKDVTREIPQEKYQENLYQQKEIRKEIKELKEEFKI